MVGRRVSHPDLHPCEVDTSVPGTLFEVHLPPRDWERRESYSDVRDGVRDGSVFVRYLDRYPDQLGRRWRLSRTRSTCVFVYERVCARAPVVCRRVCATCKVWACTHVCICLHTRTCMCTLLCVHVCTCVYLVTCDTSDSGTVETSGHGTCDTGGGGRRDSDRETGETHECRQRWTRRGVGPWREWRTGVALDSNLPSCLFDTHKDTDVTKDPGENPG